MKNKDLIYYGLTLIGWFVIMGTEAYVAYHYPELSSNQKFWEYWEWFIGGTIVLSIGIILMLRSLHKETEL